MFPNLGHVHLEPPVSPLDDEVGIDLDCEVTVVNLQNLKVVQPNLDLTCGKSTDENQHGPKISKFFSITSEGGSPGGLRGGLNLL